MSGIEWSDTQDSEKNEGDPANDPERAQRRAEMARSLARGGMDGVQIISLETAERVLTPKRRELIETLRTRDIESVRDLARQMSRDKGQVSRDLAVLAEHGIISYEEEGRTKRPYLTQEHLVVEPV